MISVYENTLIEQTKSDPIYQDLLNQCRLAEESYCALLASLDNNTRDTLEHYISLCEELEHRRTYLALEMIGQPWK